MNWTLKDLIEALEAYPADHPSPVTLSPCSHRWSYEQLAFVVEDEPTTVGALLEVARGADGATYDGWKGGEYTMNLGTEVFAVADESQFGGTISPLLLRAWLGPVPVVLPEGCSVHEDGDRFYDLCSSLRISVNPQGVWLVAGNTHSVGDCVEVMEVDPVAMEWLRTGEVTP